MARKPLHPDPFTAGILEACAAKGITDQHTALIISQASQNAKQAGAKLHPLNPVQRELAQLGFNKLNA